LSKKILCPYCGRYVNADLFYVFHYFKICLDPLPLDGEGDVGRLARAPPDSGD
jgi:hypothetical protein